MDSLADFRTQYPQYNDIPDSDLVTKLHQKFYSDMPLEEFSKKLGAKTQAPKDTSYTSAFTQGIDQPLEQIGDTAEVLGAPGLGKALKGAVSAPKNYEPAADKFINPGPNDTQVLGYGVGYLPRAIVEQAGGIAGSIASRVAGAAAGGAAGAVAGPAGAAVGATGGAFLGPTIFGGLQVIGQAARERAKNNGRTEPNDEDIAYAMGTAGAAGAIEALGAKYLPGGEKAVGGLIKKMLKSGAAEGATEAAQSVVQQTGETAGTKKGLDVSVHQAIGEGVIGAGAGSAAPVVVDGAKATKEGLRHVAGDEFTPVDKNNPNQVAAAQRVSKKLRDSEADGMDLSDVDRESDRGANAALNRVRGQNNDLMQEALNTLVRDGVLDPKKAADTTKMLEVAAAKGLTRRGKNKVQDSVSDKEIAQLESLVGDTQAGQALVGLLHESNITSGLFRQGEKGGFSRITDQFSPFKKDSRYLGGNSGGILTGGFAAATAGKSLLGQMAIVAGGRAADKLTGNRSRYEKFAKRYADPNLKDSSVPVDPSARDTQAEQMAAKAAAIQAKAAKAQAQATTRAQKAAAQVLAKQASAATQAAKQATQAASQATLAAQRTQRSQAQTMAQQAKIDSDLKQAQFEKWTQAETQRLRAADEVPGGGFDRLMYDQTGLKPSQWMKALADLKASGSIPSDIHDAVLNSPADLMKSGAGLKVLDIIVKAAEGGKYTRDPSWKGPQPAQAAPQGAPGWNPRQSAYEAQARGNQERISQTLQAVQADQSLGPIGQVLAQAVTQIGTTNNKAEAQAIMQQAMGLSPDLPMKAKVAQILSPLVDQIRHATVEDAAAANGVKVSKNANKNEN